MTTLAINLFIYTVIALIVGLYKPKWVLFWMNKPTRFTVIVFVTVLFMIAATLFGEGNKAKKTMNDTPVISTETPETGT